MEITAESARMITSQARLKGLPEIYENIKEAAEKGDIKAYWYDHISYEVEQELKLKGFNVTSSTHRNEYLVTITW